jgi:hypothetical protein
MDLKTRHPVSPALPGLDHQSGISRNICTAQPDHPRNRAELDALGFLEVETAFAQRESRGGRARPFITHHNAPTS